MKSSVWRSVAAVFVLIVTAVTFIYYFAHNPSVREQLSNIPAGVMSTLLVLYLCFTGCLALINTGTLRLCRTKISNRESVLLSMYSSIINFFGPLQSGPAFRAVYVKQKHGVKLGNYTQATLIYYLLYAMMSGACLLLGVLRWWLVPLLLLAVLAIFILERRQVSFVRGFNQLDLSAWYYLASATALQIIVLIGIYFVELHAVTSGVSLEQVIIYSGAANLALFVSITPGAIGFREAFLVFSQNLHNIPTSTIVAANTLDRAVYVAFLGLLAVGIFGSHASKQFTKFKLKS